METLDWIIIAFIAMGAVLGFAKGALKQAAAIVGLVAGLLLARALFLQVGEKLAIEIGTSVSVAQIIAFFMIWIIVPLALLFLAGMLTKVLEIVHLGFVNRFLGAVLGALKFAFLVSMAIAFIEFVDSEDELIGRTIKKSSLLYYPIEELSGMFIPTIRDVAKDMLDKDIFDKDKLENDLIHI